MTKLCQICGRDAEDTIGPADLSLVRVDVSVARAGKFPAATVVSWAGEVCDECVVITRRMADAFHRAHMELVGEMTCLLPPAQAFYPPQCHPDVHPRGGRFRRAFDILFRGR